MKCPAKASPRPTGEQEGEPKGVCPVCRGATLLLIYETHDTARRLWFCVECSVRALHAAGLIAAIIPVAQDTVSEDLVNDSITVKGRVIDAAREALGPSQLYAIGPEMPFFQHVRVTNGTGTDVPIYSLILDLERSRASLAVASYAWIGTATARNHLTVDLSIP